MFGTKPGTPVDPRSLAQGPLHPVLECLQLPRFSWHRLRKLHAMYLADQGVEPRILQAQLGHADATMALNLYTQVLPKSQRPQWKALSVYCSEMLRSWRREGVCCEFSDCF